MPRFILLPLVLVLLLTCDRATQAQAPDPELAALGEAAALRRGGRFEEAEAAFRSILEAHPGCGAARFQLALCVHARGAFGEAIPLHRAAAEHRRFRPAALYNLACASAMNDDSAGAIAALEQAVADGFSDVDAARADAELAALRADPRFEAALASAGEPWPRRLQFWIGTWDCYSASSGQLNGRNALASRLDGLVIHEQWEAVGGGSGESWNYFHAESGTWRQRWVDGRGGVLEFTGTPSGRGVLFEAERLDALGRLELVRMLVRPVEDGRVRQTGTRSLDGGATWRPRYDLVYVPQGEPLAGSGARGGS